MAIPTRICTHIKYINDSICHKNRYKEQIIRIIATHLHLININTKKFYRKRRSQTQAYKFPDLCRHHSCDYIIFHYVFHLPILFIYYINDLILHSNLDLIRVSSMANQDWPWNFRNVNSQGRTNYFQAAISRLQVNTLRAAFSLSGSECKRCALLLALMCC